MTSPPSRAPAEKTKKCMHEKIEEEIKIKYKKSIEDKAWWKGFQFGILWNDMMWWKIHSTLCDRYIISKSSYLVLYSASSVNSWLSWIFNWSGEYFKVLLRLNLWSNNWRSRHYIWLREMIKMIRWFCTYSMWIGSTLKIVCSL